jgi:large exoprotein involved in heme utilization and adhesion
VRDRQQGQFTVTGSGGLPDRPGNSTTPYATGTIQTVPSENTLSRDRPWQMGDPIIEPQGIYQLANGRLVISQECSQSHP